MWWSKRLMSELLELKVETTVLTRPGVSKADPHRNQKVIQKLSEKCLICQVHKINPKLHKVQQFPKKTVMS